MMTRLRPLLVRLRHFGRATGGAVTVEAVLMFPLLAWAFVAMFTYFDAFRTKNTAEKAAFTVSDALTRVTDGVDEHYIDGMKKLFDHLTFSDYDTAMRVTEIQWVLDDPNDTNSPGSYQISWSYAPAGMPKLTNAGLAAVKDRLPNLVHGERLILVEAKLIWEPVFNVGLNGRVFEYFIPTAPRFSSQVAWEGAQIYFDDTTGNADADGGTGVLTDEDPNDSDSWMAFGDFLIPEPAPPGDPDDPDTPDDP